VCPLPVADPGFDLTGGHGLSQRRGVGGGVEGKSLKVLKVEVKVISSVLCPYFF